MIYVETEPCYVDGYGAFFRAYADTRRELLSALANVGITARLYEADKENEHTILSEHNLGLIGQTVAIDDRGKVKLFMHKARALEAPGMTDLMVPPENIDAFVEVNPPPEEVPAPEPYNPARPQLGKVTFKRTGSTLYNKTPAGARRKPAGSDKPK